jgi:hypothetical protein
VAGNDNLLQPPMRSKAVEDAAVKSLQLVSMFYFHLQFIFRQRS